MKNTAPGVVMMQFGAEPREAVQGPGVRHLKCSDPLHLCSHRPVLLLGHYNPCSRVRTGDVQSAPLRCLCLLDGTPGETMHTHAEGKPNGGSVIRFLAWLTRAGMKRRSPRRPTG